MNKKLLFLFSMIPLCSFGQQYDLKRCIEYGLKNNHNNQIYENSRKEADARAKEALADYLPKISITATFDDNLKLQQSIIPAGILGPEPQRISFTQKYNTNGLVQLDQTIYDQSLINGLKANKFNGQRAALNTQKSQENIIYNISSAYLQIHVFTEQIGLLKDNLETYRKQIAVFQLQVEKGVTLQSDLDRVNVDYHIAVSQIRVAENNRTLAENRLKFEMGFPMDDSLAISSATEQEMTRFTADRAKSVFQAGKIADYQLSAINVNLQEINLKTIKAGALPKLSAYFRYGAVGFGRTLSPAFNDLNPYSAVGLRLNIPLFDYFKRNAQINQAKYQQLNAAENLKLSEGQFRLDYENAQARLARAQSDVEDDRRNIELARSVFNTTDLKFRKGVAGLTDWIAAQNSIKDAQNNYLNAVAALYQARLDLEKAAGTLKELYASL